MKTQCAWTMFLLCSALFFGAACSADSSLQTCGGDEDCAPSQYCARGGGVFFSTDHCVDKSSAAAADSGESADVVDVVHECGQPCEAPTPLCELASKQCVECLLDSDCARGPSTNFQGICNADNTCGVIANQCAENFVDMDQNIENGCECEFTDANDLPDGAGVDSNCDGADGIWDGEQANVVFVSANGDNAHSGRHPDEPVASIERALELAVEHERSYVLVTGGEFEEKITLQSGVHLYGGYAPDHSWKRDRDAYRTKIFGDGLAAGTRESGDRITVVARGLRDETILDGLTIMGQHTTTPGTSSFAVWAHQSERLIVQNSRIQAGAAGNGAPGRTGRIRACLFHWGGLGAQADSAVSACPQNMNLNRSGEDGDGASGEYGRGGRGGFGLCTWTADTVTHAMDGEPGYFGTPGAPGRHGEPALSAGYFDDEGAWIIPTGILSTAGGNGGGGGGGGAGGNLDYQYPPLLGMSIKLRGGDGSNGGRGGCGQAAGTHGGTGGSSFGIAVIGGQVIVRDTLIEQASGGTGGAGGKGLKGDSTPFPPEGSPGMCHNNHCSGTGGAGGPGGKGGDGGNGAGGRGGHSIGVAFARGGQAVVEASVSFINDQIEPAAGGFSISSDIDTTGLVRDIYEIVADDAQD